MPVSRLAQERIDKGLCPDCGETSAPYYLCFDCRLRRRVARNMKRLTKQGQVTELVQGRHRAYALVPDAGPLDNRWSTKVGTTLEEDRRFAPRLRGVPVDVEREVILMMRRIGVSVTADEITTAWGLLRGERKRKHGSPAADIRAIILAKRKRDRARGPRA